MLDLWPATDLILHTVPSNEEACEVGAWTLTSTVRPDD